MERTESRRSALLQGMTLMASDNDECRHNGRMDHSGAYPLAAPFVDARTEWQPGGTLGRDKLCAALFASLAV